MGFKSFARVFKNFFDIFQKYIFISSKCLLMHCIFVLTIVQLLHNNLHMAQAWFRELGGVANNISVILVQ